MRKTACFVALGAVVACGAFGGSDNGGPAPQTPDQNAVPPVPGTPITGIFVSKNGTPDGDGSLARPVSTITAGLALGKVSNQRVVVCAEEFAEQVTLVDGVSLYGYFDCSNPQQWVEVPDKKATVRSPVSPALVANGISLATRMEGFEVFAPDLSGPAPSPDKASSIGAYIRNAAGLAFGSMAIHGGNGAPGADAVAVTAHNLDKGAPTGGDGVPQQQTSCSGTSCGIITGAAFGTSSCPVGDSGGPGGKGGDGNWIFDAQCTPPSFYSPAGKPAADNGVTAAGGAGATTGSAGKFGVDGAAGQSTEGTFTPDGYVPADGTNGTVGKPGEGGGGGGGSPCWTINHACELVCNNAPFRTATGGGGGAGGCGGLPGVGGKGGGASIGAFVVASTVTMDKTVLTASNGGAAGKGGAGADGEVGGKGGHDTYGAGGKFGVGDLGSSGGGGDGGPGGGGGWGGHGTPGPSIALVFNGTRPSSTDGSLTLTPGAGGAAAPAEQRVNKPGGVPLVGALPITISAGGPGDSKPEASF